MISVIGIGNGASAIAKKFEEYPQYNIYCLNSSVEKNDSNNFKLGAYTSPDEYEKNVPNLKKFFKKLDDHLQVYIMGASYSSNYTLGILEQCKQKKIDVFYIQPDRDLLSEIP